MQSNIMVNFQFQGWHNWPDAPEHRAYLRSEHRHIFHIQVKMEVLHNDREVEFHDLLDFCQEHIKKGRLDSFSCEQIATDLLVDLSKEYPKRKTSVQVWEDGEVGAEVNYG